MSSDESSVSSSSSNHSEPTPDEIERSVEQVTGYLDQLHFDDMSVNGGNNNGSSGSGPKINPPQEFTGRKDQLKSFKLQCLVYIELRKDKLSQHRQQLLFVTSYFRGPAYEWIEPHLTDYLEHPKWEDMKTSTKTIFRTTVELFRELEATFGQGNDQLEAERALQLIRQRNSVARYKAEFQILVAKTSWNDEAVTAQFYRGLKDTVKGEIARQERPTTPMAMYDLAMKIDQRLYERQMEKKGTFFQHGANSKVQRQVPEWKDNYYGLQKMQIDATHGKPGSKKGPKKGSHQPRQGQKDKSKVECYNCHKKGHYSRECNARKQRHELQQPGRDPQRFQATQARGGYSKQSDKESRMTTPPTGTIAATKQDDHAMISWTACYDDSCKIHLSDKTGSGFFPTKNSRKQLELEEHEQECFATWDEDDCPPASSRFRATRGVPDGILTPDTSEEESENESSEEEELSEEEDDTQPMVQLNRWRVPEGDIVLEKIFPEIMRRHGIIFPYRDGVQCVDGQELHEMYLTLRRLTWGMPSVGRPTNYTTIVQEIPPLGCEFTPRGSYRTAEGVCIPKNLRRKMRELQQASGTRQPLGFGKLLGPPEMIPWMDQNQVHRIAATRRRYANNFQVWVTIGSAPAKALIDSGCTGIFMSPKFAEAHRVSLRTKREPFPLQAIDGTPVAYNKGMVTHETGHLPLRMGRHREKLQFDITESPGSDVVLGLPWLWETNALINWKEETVMFENESSQSMPLPVILWSKKQDEAKTKLAIPPEYQDFKALFEEESDQDALPKHQPWDHEIKLQPGKEPRKEGVRPMSAEKAEVLRKYIDDNLRKGLIRQSESPAGYPILFVPKANGKEYRLCVDYRGLNEITVKNSYPLPLIHELQDRLQGAQWFTAFDIPGAYNRSRMKEGEEWKTAFRTRFGLYEYLVMPFGLTNAPATFQAYINNVLRKYLDVFVVVYLDDILVYSKTYEDHVQHVRKVLQALKDAHLRVKPGKTEFHKPEVKFLGYIVSREGLKMDSKKIEAITSWPKPTTVKEVQSFLGFANFYRQFIAGYSQVATPLTNLTKKEQAFEWTQEAKQAFQELKTRFSTEPILVIFDPSKSTTLETDASDKAIGACLSQPDDKGKLRPVAYLSRKMTPAELNYEIHDKELLAIVEACRHWRVYLEGQEQTIEVITDHKNLTSFTTTKVLNRRQVRWYEELATFKLKIHYRKGSENGRADALSRRTDYMKGDKPQQFQLLKQNADGTLQVNTIAATSSVNAATLPTDIRDALATDAFATQVRATPTEYPKFSDSDGYLLFEGRTYVPTRVQQQLLQAFHDGPVRGHPGTSKMMQLMQTKYYFPRMRHAIEEYVRKCDICRRMKPDRHKPYGLLQPLKVPERPWESVAMDFIVKLPVSADPVTGEMYDGIMVVTDRFTKFGRFIPYKEAFTAVDLAHVFVKEVVANHGTPTELISDRDKLFTSNFWTALMHNLGVKHKLSTAFHPQTDGQTERLNQTLEQYLRCYVNDRQDNWIQLLSLAQIAYNHSPASATGTTPFYATYGFDPPDLTGSMEALSNNPAAAMSAQQISDMHANLRLDLMFMQQQMAKYANRKRIEGPNLKEGDKVYLLRRNIKSDKLSPKLDAVKLGPFEIRYKRDQSTIS
ncbi:hypothetical protein KC336_g12012 [Hortaea werneckii]|nr:hypothetical protein KC336_g12012 [Hortaea werneckii]